jgi:hypothetical protein
MKVYYFGCFDDVGHHLHDSDGCTISDRNATPWSWPEVDGSLAPEGEQFQSLALLHKKEGWTAIAFWDRTLDTRGNSNSAFFAEGDFTFEEMLELAKKYFPAQVKRIGTIRLKEPKC